jgi:hypothetical protein
MVIYRKIKSNDKCVERKGEGNLTAIHRKINASIENVNDAVSQADMCKTRK